MNVSIRPPHSKEDGRYDTHDAKHVFPVTFIPGVWHVTHSSLPMWKKAQNVAITYTVSSVDDKGRPTFENLVEHQPLGAAEGEKIKSIKGTEQPRGALHGAWRWRGKGPLKIVSSDWEVLGFGTVGGEDWVVTFFRASVFTHAGIDVLSRKKEGLDKALLTEIFKALESDGGDEVRKLAAQLFEVKMV